MASTVPQAKAALIDAIEARAEIQNTGIPVLWGAPTDEAAWNRSQEIIFLGTVEQAEEWGQVGGGGRRDEAYDLEVTIICHQHGKATEQQVEERAWQLRDEIQAALETDRTLGGVLNKWCAIDRTVQDNSPFTDGWGTRLRLTVHCEAMRI